MGRITDDDANPALCSKRSTRKHARPSARSDPRPGRPRRNRLPAARYRDERGDDWADIIDFLTMHPEERRQMARMLGELEAEGSLH